MRRGRRRRRKKATVREGDGRSATYPTPMHFLTLTGSPMVPFADDPEPQQQQDEKPTAEEKALLREEFVTAMHQRFLDGKDKDFDYRLNSNLDFLKPDKRFSADFKLPVGRIDSLHF